MDHQFWSTLLFCFYGFLLHLLHSSQMANSHHPAILFKTWFQRGSHWIVTLMMC